MVNNFLWFHYGLTVLAGVLCLIPLSFQTSQFETSQTSKFESSELRSGMKSDVFRGTSIMIIALVIPLALDTLADIYDYFLKKKAPKRQELAVFLNIDERIIILCGMIVCPMTAFISRDTPNLAFLYFCCNSCQLNLLFGVLITALGRNQKKYWSDRNVNFMAICICGGTVLNAFTQNYYLNGGENSNQLIGVLWLSAACVFFGCLVFFACSLRWVFAIAYPKIKKLFSVRTNESDNGAPYFLYKPLILLVTSVTCIAIFCTIFVKHGSIAMWNHTALYLNNLAYIIFLIAFYFVMIRMIKNEVVQGLVSSIYIRIVLCFIALFYYY
jgi:hypothetical protein